MCVRARMQGRARGCGVHAYVHMCVDILVCICVETQS